MKKIQDYAITKKELMEQMDCIRDDDLITFGNGLMLTFYRVKQRGENPIVFNIEFNEQINEVTGFNGTERN